MLNKKEQLDELLRKWFKEVSEQDRKLFTYDGFVCDDPQNFDGTLIIAKESQNEDGLNNKSNQEIYIDNLNTDKIPPFWTRDAILSGHDSSKPHIIYKYAILYECAEYCVEHKVLQVPEEQYKAIKDKRWDFSEILKNIAFMNLKKTGGPKKSSDEKIVKWAETKENKDNILKELEIISPQNVIICGVNLANDQYFCKSVINLIKDAKLESKIFLAYHPSYVCSYNTYIQHFRRFEGSWNL